MKASELFKELGLGDEELNEAREWVNYKHFSETVPDILTLSEYLETIYKHIVEKDAKPHKWFSERYMVERYLSSDVVVGDEYISKFNERVSKIKERTNQLPPHITEFFNLMENTIVLKKRALPKECLVFLNELYKGK